MSTASMNTETMNKTSLTLGLGDVVSIPGVGEMQVGHILNPRLGRFVVRLDKKFEPSVTIDILTDRRNLDESEVERTAAVLRQRKYSREIEHLKEDLDASLKFALGDEYAAHAHEVEAIVALLTDYFDSTTSLRDVKALFGNAVFGQVLLYHLEHETSLWNHSEVLSSTRSLAELGMTVDDLGWPNEVLHSKYVDPDV